MTRLLDLLSDGAHAGATIAEWPSGDRSTLLEVWERSERSSRWFSERFAPGERVAMLLESSVASLVALLGAWRSGQTVVSLPTKAIGVSHAAYREQLRSLRDTTGAAALVAAETAVGRYGDALGDMMVAPNDAVVDGRGPARSEHGDFVQCTSGTTGHPKAILLRSAAMAANVAAIVDRYDSGTPMVSLSWLPLSHDMGLVGLCLAPWAYCGIGGPQPGRLHLMRPEAFLRSPSSWMRACADTGATVTGGPTFALDAAATAPYDEPMDLGRLEVVCVGAEPVWPGVLRAFEAALAPMGLVDTAVSPAYGMAEATLGVSALGPGARWSSVRAAADGDATELVCSGPPLRGVEVSVDGDELLVRSIALMDGYLGHDAAIAPGGWYRTGDVGSIVDGQIVVRGRLDDLVFVAGRNVHAADVEREIMAQLGDVLGGCAVVPDGAARLVVLATLARAEGTDLESTATAVRQTATNALGVAPSKVMFVARRALQRTGTGKLRRGTLATEVARGTIAALHVSETRRGSMRRAADHSGEARRV